MATNQPPDHPEPKKLPSYLPTNQSNNQLTIQLTIQPTNSKWGLSADGLRSTDASTRHPCERGTPTNQWVKRINQLINSQSNQATDQPINLSQLNQPADKPTVKPINQSSCPTHLTRELENDALSVNRQLDSVGIWGVSSGRELVVYERPIVFCQPNQPSHECTNRQTNLRPNQPIVQSTIQ